MALWTLSQLRTYRSNKRLLSGLPFAFTLAAMLARLTSILLHAAALLLFLLASRVLPQPQKAQVEENRPTIRLQTIPYSPKSPHGGGGGRPRAEPRARVKRAASRPFVPPAITIVQPELAPIENPRLTLTSSARPQTLGIPLLDDPFASAGPPSPDGGATGTGINGTGRGGSGKGSGGSGFGGSGHGAGSVVPPVLIYKTEPEFSDEARRAKLQGTILLDAEVDADGVPRNVRVRESLGLGLDECAITAVEKWRFRPALRNGKPVPVPVIITVNFHLL